MTKTKTFTIANLKQNKCFFCQRLKILAFAPIVLDCEIGQHFRKKYFLCQKRVKRRDWECWEFSNSNFHLGSHSSQLFTLFTIQDSNLYWIFECFQHLFYFWVWKQIFGKCGGVGDNISSENNKYFLWKQQTFPLKTIFRQQRRIKRIRTKCGNKIRPDTPRQENKVQNCQTRPSLAENHISTF